VLLAARPVLAGASAALGFVVKVWPALMILSLPRSRSVKAWVAFVASTAVVLGLFATRFDGVLSFVGNQRSRGLQVEAVGALPFELYSLAGGRVSYGLEYGSYQVLMNGAEQIGTIISLLGLGLIALMAWWRFRGRLDVLPAGDVALTLVLISVATSRVYSPQYNVWLIGVCSVALLSPVTRMTRVAAILIATSLVTQLVYPWFPYDLTDGNIWIVAVQCLRIAGLCAATVLAVREMARAGRREPTVRTPASTLVSS
jgi:hypothetical protein